MASVEIYKLQDNGEEKVIAVCKLTPEGGVVCEGEEIFVKNLTGEGIRDYSDMEKPQKLFPKDGRKFLENLKYAFRSPYLSATDIQE